MNRSSKVVLTLLSVGLSVSASAGSFLPPPFSPIPVELFIAKQKSSSIFDPAVDDMTNLLDPTIASNMVVGICRDHFPAGSEARRQIRLALKKFRDHTPGVNIGLSYNYVSHMDKAQIFASPPPYDLYIDYVDNDPNAVNPFTGAPDPGTIPCHSGGETQCGDTATVNGFSMNTCSYFANGLWNSAGVKNASVISINTHCFEQDEAANRLTTDLSMMPTTSGLTHEIGHVFGLKHSGDRSLNSQQLITIMAQGTDSISVFDLTSLLDNYATNPADPYSDTELAVPEYAVSTAVRYYADKTVVNEEDILKTTFAEGNPLNLYFDTGVQKFMDCATQEDPIYYANFFDLSTAEDIRPVVRFEMYDSGNNFLSVVKNVLLPFAADSDPAAPFNEYQVKDRLPMTVDNAGGPLALGAASEQRILKFVVDPDNIIAERWENNNEVELTVTLWDGLANCP